LRERTLTDRTTAGGTSGRAARPVAVCSDPEPAAFVSRVPLSSTVTTEQFRGEVLHVVPPGERADHELEAAMTELAASRSILVCRRGGAPSLLELLWAFIRRDPIEPVTIVADLEAGTVSEGDEITTRLTSTELAGVYAAAGPVTVES
jgi:hypothetical protein